MAAKTMNVSLTSELKAAVETRVRSGRYGSASDVVRAGLRALDREEMALAWREWQEAKAHLPQEPISAPVEERVAARVRTLRRSDRGKGRRR